MWRRSLLVGLYEIFTALVFTGVVVAGVVLVGASRRQEGQHNRSSEALWDELREAHGLSRREAEALRKVAEESSLEPASLIFVEPHVLKGAAAGGAGAEALAERGTRLFE